MTPARQPVAIIGGGVIGLSVGWQLARSGAAVRIFEREKAGKGAGWVSAGMLAPFTEAGFEEPELLRLSLESRRLYPQFLRELEEDSRQKTDLQPEGTLAVALSRDDEEALKRFFDFRRELGLPVTWLPGEEARNIEPLLSPNVVSAVSIPDDLHIDPRRLLEALKTAFLYRGGMLHENSPVEKILVENDAVSGIQINGQLMNHPAVVLAAGVWSSQIPGIPEKISPPVRPVKGQILTLQPNALCRLSHIVRAPEAYLVPKPGNRLLVGATSEEMGYDLSPTAGAVLDLLQGAYEAVPAVYDCAVGEIQTGLRPGTLDNLPLIGKTGIQGLYYAAGHFRHGILLTPVTAYGMSRILEGETWEILRPFSPLRFLKSAPAQEFEASPSN